MSECLSEFHDEIACPKHGDLDLDLYNVRVADVVHVGTDLIVALAATDGRWISDGEWATVHDVTVEAVFGTEESKRQDGDEGRWAMVADRLTGWMEAATELRMVAEPDHLTLLWDPATGTPLPIPRSAAGSPGAGSTQETDDGT